MNKKLNLVVAFFFTVLLWISISGLFIQSKNGHLVASILFGAVSWGSYLAVHKMLEGSSHDLENKISGNKDKEIIYSPKKVLGLLLGLIIFGLGGLILSTGVNASSYVIATSGSALIITGYMIAHKSSTGKLV